MPKLIITREAHRVIERHAFRPLRPPECAGMNTVWVEIDDETLADLQARAFKDENLSDTILRIASLRN